jgi:hypothetical protein
MINRPFRSLRRSCFAAVLLLAAACNSDSTTAPDPVAIASIAFAAPSVDAEATDFASALAGSTAGTIHVTGSIKLPAPCYDVSAHVEASSGFVMLEVIGDQPDATCTGQVSSVGYDIVIAGSSPGPHTVAITHVVNTGRTAATTNVMQSSVVVP